MCIAPKCPNCGGEVIWEDMYETYHSKNECILCHVGTCEKCHHVIDWEGVYTFAENINIVDTGLE